MKVWIGAALLTLSVFAHADSSMIGIPNCGDWVKKKDVEDRAWLAGYMSGVASMRRYKKDPDALEGVAWNQIIVWMDNYCQSNPLANINQGGNVLWMELAKRKK